MKDITVDTFDEAVKICKPFLRLRFPEEVKDILNSGKVLYFFSDTTPGIVWPHFPVSANRIIVKELKKRKINVSSNIKVIMEIRTGNDKDIRRFMLDCFGHTVLYLLFPKASNECEDSQALIKELGLRG